MVLGGEEAAILRKIFGIALIIIVILAAALLIGYIHKKGVYKGEILEFLIDCWELFVLFGALILLGIALIKR